MGIGFMAAQHHQCLCEWYEFRCFMCQIHKWNMELNRWNFICWWLMSISFIVGAYRSHNVMLTMYPYTFRTHSRAAHSKQGPKIKWLIKKKKKLEKKKKTLANNSPFRLISWTHHSTFGSIVVWILNDKHLSTHLIHSAIFCHETCGKIGWKSYFMCKVNIAFFQKEDCQLPWFRSGLKLSRNRLLWNWNPELEYRCVVRNHKIYYFQQSAFRIKIYMFLCVIRTPLKIFGSYLFSHSWISSLNDENYCSLCLFAWFLYYYFLLLLFLLSFILMFFFSSSYYVYYYYYWYCAVRCKGFEE